MNEEQIKQWIDDLKLQAQKSLVENDVNRSFAIIGFANVIDEWLKKGRQGPLPVSEEQLRQQGLALPDTQVKLIAERGIDLQAKQSDQTNDVQVQFEQGVDALKRGDLRGAIKFLQPVADRSAEPQQRERARTALIQAQMQQQQREAQIVTEAQQIDLQVPKDLTRRRNAWRKVLEQAEETSEAQTQAQLALRQIEQAERQSGGDDTIRKEIGQLRREISQAQNEKRISVLQDCMVRIDTLLSQASTTVLTEELSNLRNDAYRSLNDLRTQTGVVSTLLQNSNHEAAYYEIITLVDQGIYEIWDNRLAKQVTAAVMLKEAAKRFVEFRKTKASEYEKRAQRALTSGNPQLAVEYYYEAVMYLTHEKLRTETRGERTYVVGGEKELPATDDQDLVTELRTEIQQAYEDTQVLRDRWNTGKALFDTAERETDPRKAIGLLRNALATFNQDPPLRFIGIEAAILRREEDVSSSLAADVNNACADAESALRRDAFVEARKSLSSARTSVAELSHPSPSLQTAIARLEDLTKQEREQEQRFIQVRAIIDTVTALLAATPPHPEHADAQLQKLQGTEWDLPEIIGLKQKLATMQEAEKNWTDAQQAYQKGQWQSVVTACTPLLAPSSQYQREAVTKLNGRAEAMLDFAQAQKQSESAESRRQFYADGIALLEKHETDNQTRAAYEEAKKQFQEMVQLAQADDKVKPILERLEQLVATTQHVAEDDLRQPEREMPLAVRSEWSEINEEITKLLVQRSTLTGKIQDLQSRLFTAWRDDYLKRVRKVTSRGSNNLTPLYRMVAELQQANLLYEPADRRLAREIEIDYRLDWSNSLRARIAPRETSGEQTNAQLSRPQLTWKQIGTNWKLIEEHEQKILDLIKLGYRPSAAGEWSELDFEERLYNARISRRLSDVQVLLTENTDHKIKEAVEQLEKDLASEVFSGDVILTIELIKLYWRSKRFDTAYQYAQGLRYSNHPNAQDTSKLWHGLTKVTEHFNQGEYSYAIIHVSHIRANIPTGHEQVEQWLNENIQPTIDRLIDQAQKSGAKKDILEAIQQYAQAQQLLDLIKHPNDPLITEGLKGLSSAVMTEIEMICQSAENLRLSGRDPEPSIGSQRRDLGSSTGVQLRDPAPIVAQGEELCKRLKAIQVVQGQLRLEDSKVIQLETSLRDLEERLERWRQGLRYLKRANEICVVARRESWDFSEARQLIKTVRNDDDFKAQATMLGKKLDDYESWVKQLMPILDQLEIAIRSEQFDTTITTCNTLEDVWMQMRSKLEDPLDEQGLKQQKKMQCFYIHIQRREDDWREHRQIANDLKQNLKQWSDCAAAMIRTESQARSQYRQAKQALDEQTKSLHELSVDFGACERTCVELEQKLQELQDLPEPQSNLAKKERQKLDPVLQRRPEIEQWKTASITYREKCEEQIARLTPLLDQIRTLITNPHFANSKPNNDMLEMKINEAAEIDPLDPEVLRDQTELEQRRKLVKPVRRGLFGR